MKGTPRNFPHSQHNANPAHPGQDERQVAALERHIAFRGGLGVREKSQFHRLFPVVPRSSMLNFHCPASVSTKDSH